MYFKINVFCCHSTVEQKQIKMSVGELNDDDSFEGNTGSILEHSMP